jgi:hypothetical protein
MPFNAPFKSIFNIGDLLYGISEERLVYAHCHKGFECLRNHFKPIYLVDQYAANEKQKAFFETTGLTVPHNQDTFWQVLQAHPKYKSAFIDEPFQGRINDINHVVISPINIARKCKAGLEWLIASKEKFSIHFILDEIYMCGVAHKKNFYNRAYPNALSYFNRQLFNRMEVDNFRGGVADLNDKIICKSYTSSELRWIYRNRNNLKVQKEIQFWFKNEPCSPPWDPAFDKLCSHPVAELWSSYIPKSKRT